MLVSHKNALYFFLLAPVDIRRGGPLADDDGLDAVLKGNKAGGRGGELPAIMFPCVFFFQATRSFISSVF